MALSNVNEKSAAPMMVGAFLPSLPVPRFAQTRERHLSMQNNGLESKEYTNQEIQTFYEGIDALELPPLIAPRHGVSLPHHLLGTYAATKADICRGAPSAHELSDFLHMHHASSVQKPLQDKEPLKKHAVVLSSQINVCDVGVSERQRELVHSFLSLAQLAARESAPDGGDELETPFWDYLLKHGWVQLDSTETKTQMLDMNATLNNQIVSILTDAMEDIPGRPASGATIKIVNILRGLDTMDLTCSWMELFRRSSIRQYGADFQFSTTTIPTNNDMIVLDLVSVAFNAGRSISRVMFFTFETTVVKLEITKMKLCITPGLLENLGTILKEKVRPYVPSEVMSIEDA
ncbi:hypothetical protein MHU86_22441 [Fragilaria crotonensis]|nr:hypothetical protein MHU86_22441 [Fragilaria crotonensis]